MTRAVYRYEIPVDDAWHDLELSGPILHVASRSAYTVDVWALHTGGPTATRTFRVYGTGHPLPDGTEHAGTALTPGGHLVWHLIERR